MRVYLACTVRGDRGGATAARAVCERLQALGHEVLTTHLLADDVNEAEARLTEADVYRRDIDWLDSCHALVAEASGSSYGVGFEVGYVLGRARETGQRVVLLHDRARRPTLSRLIAGNSDRFCWRCEYTSVEEAVDFVTSAITAPSPDRARGPRESPGPSRSAT